MKTTWTILGLSILMVAVVALAAVGAIQQDRIQTLEAQNARLRDSWNVIEGQYKQAVEGWQQCLDLTRSPTPVPGVPTGPSG